MLGIQTTLLNDDAPNLLLVDDEVNVLTSLKRLLRKDGYGIFTAENAAEALRILASESVRVVISDYKMPQVSGTTLLEEVRQRYPNTVRLILSGQADLGEIVRAMDTGGIYKFLTKPWNEELLRADVREAFRRSSMEGRIARAVTHHALTGLQNRNGFAEQFDLFAAKHDTIAVLVAGLDRFQNINAVYGQDVGDAVLKEMGTRLALFSHPAAIGHLSSDAFAVVVPNVDEDDVRVMANKMLTKIREPLKLGEDELLVTASIGIDSPQNKPLSCNECLTRASTALAVAKEHGGDRYVPFVEEMRQMACRRSRLENDLRKAIDTDELVLVYQPQYDLSTGRLVGVEVLIRWHHRQLGPVAPAEFVPIAEQTGLILPLGEWALRDACRQACHWQQMSGDDFTVAVNVSPLQLANEHFPDLVRSVLGQTQLNPARLELEITETALLSDTAGIRDRLTTLKNLGVRLALDDFGTGYSCMSYLKDFPFDKLKIDRAFVRGVSHHSDLAPVTDGIISIAQAMNLHVIAEGVETEEELDFLKARGCNTFQGFLLSRPIPAEEITRLFGTTRDAVARVDYVR